jgi:MFS transporter, ACS family, hexuronate transporter
MEKPLGKFRWRILALLFFATTINYLDRSIIAILGPTLRNHVFYWTDADYANITTAFQIAYSLGLIAMGAFIDKFGTRLGYAVSIAIWSIFGMLHATITKSMGWIGFALARIGLGFGESGNFPAAVKTVAEWFPKKERAFATGIFNAGSNVGALLAPLLIPLFVANDGKNWQFAFLLTGFFSATWFVFWLKTYKKPSLHPKLSKEELNYITSDSEKECDNKKIPWKNLYKVKETWAFVIAKTTDAVWLFYIFWGGFFLNRTFGLELQGLALPLIIIFVVADIGSVGGGLISMHFIKKGWSVNKSRKITMLICTMFILPVIFAPQTNNQWIAVLLIALAAGGHQAWSANVLTLASDLFPKKATASVVGIGGMVGYALGATSNFVLGHVLTNSGPVGYVYAFGIAGSIYLFALLFVHLIVPKMTPLDEDLKQIENIQSL